jgi:hypothetical protein
MNDWNYDASRTLASLPVSDLENNKRLIFITQSVRTSVPVKLLPDTKYAGNRQNW